MIIIAAEAVVVHNQLEKLDHILVLLQVVDALPELPQVVDAPQALEQALLLLVEEGQRLEGVH